MIRVMNIVIAAVVFVVGCSRPRPVTPESRVAARAIWADRCANCHGERGFGDGPGALILPVRPRVLADSGWQAQVTDERIATVIVEGGPAVGLDPAMAANADLRRHPDVVAALVEIVRAL